LAASYVLPAGETQLVIRVAPNDDALAEGDETIVANLIEPLGELPTNYRIAPDRQAATVTLHDNDRPDATPSSGATPPRDRMS
jgi:hypothetical protein